MRQAGHVAADYHVSRATWAIHDCNVWRHQFT